MRTRTHFLVLSFSLIFLTSGTLAAPGNSTAGEDQGKKVLVELDKATWISDIKWNPPNSSQIKVVVHSKIPKPVSIQEIPDYTGQSGSFQPMKSVTLSKGKNTISVSVNGRGKLGTGVFGVALTDSNNGVYYRRRNLFLFENITRFHFWIGLFLVGISVPLQMLVRAKVSDMILKKVREIV
ncbi:MAG: hypothetical protein ABEJ98_03355 [Candidatus Nanohaloarchaea archaeon]